VGTGGSLGGVGGEASDAGGTAGGGGRDGSAAAGGTAQDGGPGDRSGSGGAGGTGGSRLPPVTDYAAPGPFMTTTEAATGPGGNYTIYRPKTLGENGFLHPPIIFGAGTGMQVSQLAGLLSSFATHGFVVIGVNKLDGGPGDPAHVPAMTAGLDWIIAQNSMPGTYQGKLDVTHAVSMGYSVGGTAAVGAAGHAAVATTVSIHGHTASAALHGPMLQTTGSKDTVGMPLQQATYAMSQVQTFLATLTNADHFYIQSNNGGEERPAIIAWLRYWIYNDTGAKNYFYGNDCVLCKAPWENPQRKNWP
jgi:hypothetical protein